MTTTPDPKTMREITRKHIQSGRIDVGASVAKHFGSDVLTEEELWAWEYAVEDERRKATVTVSWPDEQPQDERDGDSMRPEDVPDGLVQAAADAIHAFYAAHPDNESEDDAIRVLLAAALEARDAQGTEYGIRADFIDTTLAEFTVAETLGEALEALDEFDAKYAGKVLSRELTVRPVGEPRKVGDVR